MNRSVAAVWLLYIFFTPLGQLLAEPPAADPTATVTKTADDISADDVGRHIRHLAGPELKGRSGREALLAAQYIRGQFERSGLKPLFDGDSYFQQIPGADDENGRKTVVGQNVGAWIPGSDPAVRDEMIIVSAHYDHLGIRNGQIYPGADDNASGVSMMLEVARQIAAAEVKPRRSVVFVGFDLEERMLWGSRWFVAHPPWPLERVKLFITADMIGRSLGNLPLPTVFVLGSEHAPQLKEVLNQVDRPQGLEIARLGVDLIGTRSDYGPFRDQKVPFLFFSTGEHPDYHTPNDVPERIDYEKAAKVSTLVLRITTAVADGETTPEWSDAAETDLDEAKALHRIATLLMQSKNHQELGNVQQLLISHVKSKTGQILERGEMTPTERTWLTRMSQLLLLSVF